MRIRCPDCRNALEVLADSSFKDVECPSCGSKFNLVGSVAATQSYTRRTRTIGSFELIEQLGVGTFGSVWKAKDTQLDRFVAIKTPRKEQLNGREAELFLRDARAAAQLRHPNIVAVHEVGRSEGTIYISMDYVDGADLAEWLQSRPLSPRDAAALMVKVASAIQHAHERGIIHRDLKPANVMMDRKGEPHITDFGLAKRNTGEITMTIDGATIGTPAYMSPEQAAGKAHQADGRSDIYSLGVILYELLTGTRPFRGDQRMLIVQILEDSPPPPRRLNSRVPRDLETICLKCLRKEPDRRYATAGELAADLGRWMNDEPIVARPVHLVERAWIWCRKRPTLCGLAAGLAAVVLLGLAMLGLQWRMHQEELLDAERRRVANMVTAVEHASGTSVPYAIRPLHDANREMVLAELQERYLSNNSNTRARQRRRVAYALASFGDVRMDLVSASAGVPPSESDNLVTALQADPTASREWVNQYRRVSRQQSNLEGLARLAIISLHLEDPAPAAAMCRAGSDPVQRTTFIRESSTWHGDLEALTTQVARTNDPELLAAYCLALAQAPPERLSQGPRAAVAVCEQRLATWYRDHSHAGVHSAAEYALRQWQHRLANTGQYIGSRGWSDDWLSIEIPQLDSDHGEPGQRQWYINRLGMTMLELPPGTFVLPGTIREANLGQEQLVRQMTIPSGTFLSDREITLELFQRYVGDPAVPERERPSEWPEPLATPGNSPEHPAQAVSWVDAIMFCNWLSRQHQLPACYVHPDDGETGNHDVRIPAADGWYFIPDAGGYRLPSEAEWEYACRAGALTRFCFGDDQDQLPDHAVFLSDHAMPCGGRLPNAWGFFDMHGNVEEWCHDVGRGVPPVVRGGAWQSPSSGCTALASHAPDIHERIAGRGFRVARTVAGR
ncbi:MAG: protein kinase [Pirellulaceae bacterium]|nr:protein kinase [Pirellulaceae bacterium]